MNRVHRGILIGLALGNSQIVTNPEGNAATLVLYQDERQREYAEHKAKLLHSVLGGKEPKVESERDFIKIRKSNSYFRILRKRMYTGGRKVITRQTLDWLTPQGLAIWWQDKGHLEYAKHKSEGYITSRRGKLQTFLSLEENIVIIDWFSDTYDIRCVPQKVVTRAGNESYSIRFNTENMKKLIPVIERYVIPSMNYKIDMKYEQQQQECMVASI